jgi:hypothetical protein
VSGYLTHRFPCGQFQALKLASIPAARSQILTGFLPETRRSAGGILASPDRPGEIGVTRDFPENRLGGLPRQEISQRMLNE